MDIGTTILMKILDAVLYLIHRAQKKIGWGREDIEEEFNPLDAPIYPPAARANPMLVQTTVESIISYAQHDAEKYNDVSAAIMEYDQLSYFEQRMAFFFLLGQYILATNQSL